MKEFNYKRAWREYVKPEFEKLSPAVKELFTKTEAVVDSLEQDGGLVKGYTPELLAAFNAVPAEELAWASEVVYYYGHLASNKAAQKGGLYWKFRGLANTSLIKREKVDCSKPLSTPGLEAMQASETRMKQALNGFDDHKEGTEYDNDELPKFLTELLPELAGVVELLKADNVNYKPHPFMIGPKHFPKDGGMFIQPRQAPCAMQGCNLSYDEHTSDRALFVRPLIENEPDIKAALQKIVEACTKTGIKLDGFALVK